MPWTVVGTMPHDDSNVMGFDIMAFSNGEDCVMEWSGGTWIDTTNNGTLIFTCDGTEAASTIEPLENTFSAGSSLYFYYTCLEVDDYINIYSAGDTAYETPLYQQQMTTEDDLQSGRVEFADGLDAGDYKVAVVRDGSVVVIADFATAVLDIVTDKCTYNIGEDTDIAITYNNTTSTTDWIGIYKEGITPSSGNPSILWSYVAVTSTAESLTFTDAVNSLEAGRYKVVLLQNDGYTVQASYSFTVVEGETPDVSLASVSYNRGLTSLTVYYKNAETSTDWVGLYSADETPGSSTPSTAWGHVGSNLSSGSVALSFTALSAGDYKICFCYNDGYTVLASVDFTVVDTNEAIDAPIAVDYSRTRDEDGYADGTVSITEPSDTSGINNYVLYWGDDNGALSDYEEIATLDEGVTTYTMVSNTIIPENATKLLAYSSDGSLLSASAASFNIPASWRIDRSNMTASFEVISDAHITSDGAYADHLTAALSDIVTTNPDSDAIFSNGDNVDIGSEATYDLFLSLLVPYESQLPEIYYAIGNHEYFGSYSDMHHNTDLNCTQKAQLYLDKMGALGVYYDTYINDIHFIVLGSEEALVADTSEDGYVSDDAYISDEQFDWLKEKLAETEGMNKPIFVFLHQPMSDTVAGTIGGKTGQGWNGLSDEQDAELREILFKYPQVIMFNGHTHWILESANEMYDGGEDKSTIFNTASVGYLWTDVPTESYVEGSQGLYVETYSDKVLVRGRNFESAKWIPSASFIVDMDEKYDYIHKGTNSDDSSSGDSKSGSTTTSSSTATNPSVESTTSGNGTTIGVSLGGMTDSNGNVTSSITAKTAASLVDGAVAAEEAGNKAVVSIELDSGLSAPSVEATIPKSAFSKLANNTDADLTLTTGIGTFTFNSVAIDNINEAGKDDISITMTKVDSSEMSVEIASQVGDRPVYRFAITSGSSTISDFGGGTATISVPYRLVDGEDPNAIVVYYISNSGELQIIRGCYNATDGAVEFTTTHFSEYAVGYNAVSFGDVVSTDWYHDAVTFISARGITSGTSTGVFNANATLTRGQFMVMIMRAYGIEADQNPMDNFEDAGDTYYTNYLAAAKRLSITNGIGDNLFAPDSEISRQDMFTLLYRTLDVLGELPVENNSKTIADFNDSGDISSYAQQAMNAFVKADVVSGCNGKLDPQGTSTRAQIAQVLYNLLSA